MQEHSESLGTEGGQVDYRDIAGFPGYRVGSDGSVWSCRAKGAANGRTGAWHRLRARPRRTRGKRPRYLVLEMRPTPGGKLVRFYVHRLVLTTFVGPRPEGLVACHNDGDWRNNRLDNLRWDTQRANLADQIGHGTRLRGELCPWAKLTDDDIRLMHQLRRSGHKQQQIADRFGIHPASVSAILSGHVWRHIKEEFDRPPEEAHAV